MGSGKTEKVLLDNLSTLVRAGKGGTSARELLSVNQVAQEWGCSPWTVRKWESAGKLTAVRVGKLVRFEREAMDAFVKRGRE